MVAAGPRPGKMPTMVPRKQPTKHQKRLYGCSATAKPCRRPPTISISEPEEAGRKLDAQRERKDQVEPQRGEDGGCAGSRERALEHDRDREEREQREAREESERPHQGDREREGRPRTQRRRGRPPVD